MKQLILHIIFCLCLSFAAPVFAQPGNPRIDALKTEYIKQRLNLSDDEGQKFWPIYNNYQKEMNQLFRERHAAHMAERRGDGPPPDEIKFESRMLDIKKRYRNQFMEILPKEKVSLFYQAEREFRQRLIDELRQRKQDRP